MNDSITDFSSVDAASIRHWRAQIRIPQPEWCYEGSMKTGAAERRYLGKEVRPAEGRTFPQSRFWEGIFLHPFPSTSLSDWVYRDVSQNLSNQKLRQVIPSTTGPILPKSECLLSCSSWLSWSLSAPVGYYPESRQHAYMSPSTCSFQLIVLAWNKTDVSLH